MGNITIATKEDKLVSGKVVQETSDFYAIQKFRTVTDFVTKVKSQVPTYVTCVFKKDIATMS